MPSRPPARRRKRQGPGLGQCGDAADGAGHAVAADAADAELQPHGDGDADRAAGADRGVGGAAGDGRAVRVRGDAGVHRAGRDHHAQFGHPGGPDRAGSGAGLASGGGDRRRGGAADAADPADRGGGDPGAGAAGVLGVLGADGDRHHGRTGQRDRADAVLRAGAVRGLDPGA